MADDDKIRADGVKIHAYGNLHNDEAKMTEKVRKSRPRQIMLRMTMKPVRDILTLYV